MADFNRGYILTDAGKILQAKVEAGATLRITKIVIGSGTVLSLDDYRTRLTLVSERISMLVQNLKQEGNYCIATASLSSETIETGFYATEIGLYALDDGVEILYAVAYDESPIYVPSKYDGVYTKKEFNIFVGFSDNTKTEIVLPNDTKTIIEYIENSAIKAIEAEKGSKTARDQAELFANNAATEANNSAVSADIAQNVAKKLSEENYPKLVHYLSNAYFEIDINGGLMPNANPLYDMQFELDPYGDIMPKVV